jgi:hypothetical protein
MSVLGICTMCGEYQSQLCRCDEVNSLFISVTLSRDDWEEVREALSSKALAVRRGELGPEIELGEDEAWLEDLARIENTLDEALQ